MPGLPQLRVEYPDQDVQWRVAMFLNSRHFSNFRKLDVAVYHGRVTLRGQLDSFYEKQVAINSCQHVAGVLGLVDEIDVREPMPRRAK